MAVINTFNYQQSIIDGTIPLLDSKTKFQ